MLLLEVSVGFWSSLRPFFLVESSDSGIGLLMLFLLRELEVKLSGVLTPLSGGFLEAPPCVPLLSCLMPGLRVVGWTFQVNIFI